jgi:hypothetical protein
VWSCSPTNQLKKNAEGLIAGHPLNASAQRVAESNRAVASRAEAANVAFCHEFGLDYVSCSPYRVPLARLGAARAALKESGAAAYTAADDES